MESDLVSAAQPHAVMFPYPAQGHINPMMQLAKKLLSEDFIITFINTGYNHRRLMVNNKQAAEELLELAPRLRLEFLEDGLPENHGRFNENVNETTVAILSLPGKLTKLVRKIDSESPCKVTCIIADSFCTWVQDVADVIGIPRVSLWTTPVHGNLAYRFQHKLIDEGYIPLKGVQKLLSQTVSCIPGIHPMKLEDYVSFFLVDSSSDFLFQCFLRLLQGRTDEATWNLGNNFADLEADAVAAFIASVPNFIPIGPLVLMDTSSARPPSLWCETDCRTWLSQHRPRSVLYISFGSIINMPEPELADLVQGIESSGFPFLWAVRPDQTKSSQVLAHLTSQLADAPSKGLIVDWAPQIDVLKHPSVGGILSHCGWNSTVEALCYGVPIVARPGGFAEQCMTAHYVCDVWNVGVRLPVHASPEIVSSRIVSVLGDSSDAVTLRQRLHGIRTSAEAAVSAPSGASYSKFRMFVDDMRNRCAKLN